MISLWQWAAECGLVARPADSTLPGRMRYRLLGRSGLKVASLSLGCMTMEQGGGTDAATAARMLDRYRELGGNLLDVADNYPGAEEVLGGWLSGRRDRDQIIIGTKQRFPVPPHGPNDVGCSRHHLIAGVERSLRALRTDRIDLLQLHCWDFVTPIEETLRAVDDLVRDGKVRYVGASNYAGWHVAKAAALCQARGWTPLISLQAQYSLLCRSIEWEVLPACRDHGVGVTGWSPLAAGWLSGKYRRDAPPPVDSRFAHAAATLDDWRRVVSARTQSMIPHPAAIADEAAFQRLRADAEADQRFRIIDSVIAIAGQLGRTPSQVALAWLLAQEGVSAVVIGARTLAQFEDNLAAAELDLPADALAWLSTISDPGQPYPIDFFTRYGIPWR